MKKLGDSKSGWYLVVIVCFFLYIFLSIFYMFLGNINSDEGWYLYASKSVFDGKMPYRDFAYTQTPLLPYIYGISLQLAGPSVYVGRATSIVFSAAAFLLGIAVAYRHHGWRCAGVTALLFVSFTYGIYFLSIVKTYALLSFFFLVTFLLLSSKMNLFLKLPLSITFAFLSMMVRLSAFFFFLSVLIFGIQKGLRLRSGSLVFVTAMTSIILCIVSVALFSTGIENVSWNLVGHHVSQWEGASIAHKVGEIILRRIPQVLGQYFGLYVFGIIAIGAAAVLDSQLRGSLRGREDGAILAVGVGLLGFGASHLSTGGWYMEYFVPGVVAFFPVVGILYCRLAEQADGSRLKPVLTGMLVAVVLLPILEHNVRHVDFSGGGYAVEKVRAVGAEIENLTAPSDEVFVLGGLVAVVEADRSVLPGMSMAQFSYQEMESRDAKHLGVVNGEMIVDYLARRLARVTVITENDWVEIENRGLRDAVSRHLTEGYKLVFTKDSFGQRNEQVSLYLRKGE